MNRRRARSRDRSSVSVGRTHRGPCTIEGCDEKVGYKPVEGGRRVFSRFCKQRKNTVLYLPLVPDETAGLTIVNIQTHVNKATALQHSAPTPRTLQVPPSTAVCTRDVEYQTVSTRARIPSGHYPGIALTVCSSRARRYPPGKLTCRRPMPRSELHEVSVRHIALLCRPYTQLWTGRLPYQDRWGEAFLSRSLL